VAGASRGQLALHAREGVLEVDDKVLDDLVELAEELVQRLNLVFDLLAEVIRSGSAQAEVVEPLPPALRGTATRLALRGPATGLGQWRGSRMRGDDRRGCHWLRVRSLNNGWRGRYGRVWQDGCGLQHGRGRRGPVFKRFQGRLATQSRKAGHHGNKSPLSRFQKRDTSSQHPINGACHAGRAKKNQDSSQPRGSLLCRAAAATRPVDEKLPRADKEVFSLQSTPDEEQRYEEEQRLIAKRQEREAAELRAKGEKVKTAAPEKPPAKPVRKVAVDPDARERSRERLWAAQSFLKWTVIGILLLICGGLLWTGIWRLINPYDG